MNKLGDRTSNRLAWLLAAALGLATVLVFGRSFHAQFVNFDDPMYVTENPHTRVGLTWAGVKWAFTDLETAGNWHPVTWLSHMVDCQFFGQNPTGHHVVSLLLHAANAMILLGMLYWMTGALWRSAAVAAFFAIHPLRAESVAWIAERKDVLSLFFGLLCLWSYAVYARRKKWGFFIAAVILFALAVMAKPMMVTLPGVMLLMDFWPLDRVRWADGLKWARLAAEKLPFVALVVLSSLLTMRAQGTGGGMPGVEVFSMNLRIQNALISVVKYVAKTACPSGLSIQYQYPEQIGWGIAGLAGAAVLGVTVTVVVLARRRGYLATGWLWFLGTLAPVIGLVQVGEQAMADRYTYLPCIGLSIAVVWGIAELGDKLPAMRSVLTAAAGAALAVSAVLTWVQVGYWHDSVALFERAVAVNPDYYFTRSLLGRSYLNAGFKQDALREHQRAIELRPDSTVARINYGKALAESGDYERAVGQYDMAVRIYVSLAQANAAAGNADQARKLMKDTAMPYYNIGGTLQKTNPPRYDDAEKAYRLAIERDPRMHQAYLNLGLVLIKVPGHTEEEVFGCFEKAKELAPDYEEAWYNLGRLYQLKGDLKRAIEHYDQALKIKPDYEKAQRYRNEAVEKLQRHP